MQGKIYEIPLDISSGVLTQQIREVVTEDMGTNTFRFKLVRDKHIPYPLTGTIVRMIAKTPSGARIQQECTIENAVAGTISLILKQSLILEPGSYVAEIQIYDEITQSIRLTTPTFAYHVRESLQTDDSIKADNNYTILQETLADARALIIEIQGMDTIKGDKGERGIQGAKGDKGEQGIQGNQGIKGDKGERGVQGAKGDKGDRGLDATWNIDGGTPSSNYGGMDSVNAGGVVNGS